MGRVMMRILLVALLVVFLGAFFAVPVLAAGLSNGDVITVGKDEVVDDDLYVAARTLIVDGTVNGDIFAVAQEIIINGTVNGGVTVAARTVTITGTVTRGARIAAQTINISGEIGRDLFAAGSDFTVANTGAVKRDLFFGAQIARIEGNVAGNVKGGATGVTITGKLGADAELWATDLTLADDAEIVGKLTYTSDKQVDIQSRARVGGRVTQLHPPKRGSTVGGRILGFFMIAVTGIIVTLLAGSRRLTQIADSIRRKPLPSLGWGALLLVGTPIAAIIVMITVVGIPLALIVLVLYAIALYLSQIPVALLIGRLILRGYADNEQQTRTLAAMLLGLLLILLVGFVPVLNAVSGVLVILLGLGSLAVWAQSAWHRPAAPVTNVK